MAFADLMTLFRNNFKVFIFIIVLVLILFLLLGEIDPITETLIFYIKMIS